MDFLEEEIYGQNHCVSSSLLALSQDLSMADAEKLMSGFLDSHKDLQASYKVKTKIDSKFLIKVTQTLKNTENAKIYILGPHNTTDPVIIAELTQRVLGLQLKKQVEQLQNIGFQTNPKLNNEFSAESNLGHFGPMGAELMSFKPASSFRMKQEPKPDIKQESSTRSRKTTAKKPMFTKTTKEDSVKQKVKKEAVIKDENVYDDESDNEPEPETMPEPEPETIPESIPEPIPEPIPQIKQETAPKPANKPTTGVKRVNSSATSSKSKTAKKKPQPGLAFAKIDRSAFLAQIKKPTKIEKPVEEKVVISEAPTEDTSNLEHLFDGPAIKPEPVHIPKPEPEPDSESEQEEPEQEPLPEPEPIEEEPLPEPEPEPSGTRTVNVLRTNERKDGIWDVMTVEPAAIEVPAPKEKRFLSAPKLEKGTHSFFKTRK